MDLYVSLNVYETSCMRRRVCPRAESRFAVYDRERSRGSQWESLSCSSCFSGSIFRDRCGLFDLSHMHVSFHKSIFDQTLLRSLSGLLDRFLSEVSFVGRFRRSLVYHWTNHAL